MLSGVFRRAVIAHLLIGVMLVPLGICMPRTQKAAHCCCAGASDCGSQAQNNCCTARSTEPAIVVATALPGATHSSDALEFIPQSDSAGRVVFSNRTTIPPRGSPPGAFQLRI
jgi:hypothetical protein